MACGIARFGHGIGQITHRVGGFAKACGLAFGAAGQILRGGGNFARPGAHGGGGARHFRHLIGQRGHRVVEITAQRFVFGREGGVEAMAQTALLQRVQPFFQRAGHLGLHGQLGLALGAAARGDRGADAFQRAGDFAQFVMFVRARHRDIELALGHGVHRIAQAHQRPGHPEPEHDQHRQRHCHRRAAQNPRIALG